ncbi:DUF6907 domain-containing protein [Streptomyces sp. NPDC058290]|uniref:DUF6907 domain-containing protein n=1 Tax=Streptomyces sp. NPDC058290 TaxID=3346426 RepID=UPI0036ED25EF
MSNTVPADLPRMFRPEPKLAAMPVQPSAKNRETLAAAPARTWSFLDRTTGNMQEVTCLQGCTVDHSMDRETPTHPEDIWCATSSSDVHLPINESGEIEQFRVLGAFIRQEPFSKHLHERVPHAQVEIVDDHFMESLDPDGLATVILTLEAQLSKFRAVHAQLVELREQGRVQL